MCYPSREHRPSAETAIGGLGLEFSDNLHLRGRKAQPLVVMGETPLTEEDLEALVEERGTKTNFLQTLNARHKLLAQCFASGMSGAEVASATGFTQSTVSILKSDPLVQSHIQFLEEENRQANVGMREKLALMSEMAIDIKIERMFEDPDGLTMAQLDEAIKLGADRTGFGPTQKSEVSVKVGLADKLEQSRLRADNAKAALLEGNVIEGTIVE